jgi:hypothetical protein
MFAAYNEGTLSLFPRDKVRILDIKKARTQKAFQPETAKKFSEVY